MSVDYEELEAQALDNRRRLMKSSIFGDEPEPFTPPSRASEPPVIRNAQRYSEPPPSRPQNTPQPSATPAYAEYRPTPVYVEEVAMDQPIAGLSAFPNFRFDIVQPENASDLGIQRRPPQAHVVKATRVELSATGEMEQLRDEMARQAIVFAERMKGMAGEEPLKINNAHITQQFERESPAARDTPEITTRTEFLYPDQDL